MNWLSEIKKHHEAIKRAFIIAINDPSESNVKELKFLINAHSIAEEAVIYPQLSKHGINDEQLEKEQTGAKEEIHYLSHHVDEPDIKGKLKKLMKAVLEHAVVHEEHKAFPKLMSKLSTPENMKLGDEYMTHYDKWCDTGHNTQE
jgi:hemerythrin superfamily protein